jgi:hypothetical protein
MMLSCASTGRPEHGTRRTSPKCSGTTKLPDSTWPDYYENRVWRDFFEVEDLNAIFRFFIFFTHPKSKDLYFVGIKKGKDLNDAQKLKLDQFKESIPRFESAKQMGMVVVDVVYHDSTAHEAGVDAQAQGSSASREDVYECE